VTFKTFLKNYTTIHTFSQYFELHEVQFDSIKPLVFFFFELATFDPGMMNILYYIAVMLEELL